MSVPVVDIAAGGLGPGEMPAGELLSTGSLQPAAVAVAAGALAAAAAAAPEATGTVEDDRPLELLPPLPPTTVALVDDGGGGPPPPPPPLGPPSEPAAASGAGGGGGATEATVPVHHEAPAAAAAAAPVSSATAGTVMAAPAAKKRDNLFQRWWTAAVSASLAECVTFPLDFTKTRMQLYNELGRGDGPRRGMVATARGVFAAEGAMAFYGGLPAAVIRQSVYGGIGVGLYHPVRGLLCGEDVEGAALWRRIAAGCITGGVGQVRACVRCQQYARARNALVVWSVERVHASCWEGFIKYRHDENVRLFLYCCLRARVRDASKMFASLCVCVCLDCMFAMTSRLHAHMPRMACAAALAFNRVGSPTGGVTRAPLARSS